jgi:hypothetical protein
MMANPSTHKIFCVQSAKSRRPDVFVLQSHRDDFRMCGRYPLKKTSSLLLDEPLNNLLHIMADFIASLISFLEKFFQLGFLASMSCTFTPSRCWWIGFHHCPYSGPRTWRELNGHISNPRCPMNNVHSCLPDWNLIIPDSDFWTSHWVPSLSLSREVDAVSTHPNLLSVNQ